MIWRRSPAPAPQPAEPTGNPLAVAGTYCETHPDVRLSDHGTADHPCPFCDPKGSAR